MPVLQGLGGLLTEAEVKRPRSPGLLQGRAGAELWTPGRQLATGDPSRALGSAGSPHRGHGRPWSWMWNRRTREACGPWGSARGLCSPDNPWG